MAGDCLKIGIVGAGFIVKASHVPAIAQSEKCVIKGFFDIKKELADESKKLYLRQLKKHKNPLLETAIAETKSYDSLESLIDDVDIINIATPPKYHLENLRAAVDAGKHVICEKPLERNWWAVNAYSDTFQAIRDKKVKFVLHTQAIWNPLVQAGRNLLENGIVGDIDRIRILQQGKDPKHTVALPALWDKFNSGGGSLTDIGPHPYSVMQYWLGGTYKPVNVKANLLSATIPVRTIGGKPGTKVTVADDAHVTITWRDDAGHELCGDLEATWNKRDWANGSRCGGPSIMNYEARGSKGVLTFPYALFNLSRPIGLGAGYVFRGEDGSRSALKFKIPPPGIEDASFFDEFMDVINGNTRARNDLEFAEDMLKVFGAAYLSRKRGFVDVTLDEFMTYANDIAKDFPKPDDQIVAVIRDLFVDF